VGEGEAGFPPSREPEARRGLIPGTPVRRLFDGKEYGYQIIISSVVSEGLKELDHCYSFSSKKITIRCYAKKK